MPDLNEQLRAEFEADMRKAFGDDETFERDEHGCYINNSWRDAFIGYRAAARRQHGSAAQAVEPKRRDIFAICDAYESGIGHGLQRDGHKSGAIFGNPECGMAYEIGYEEGEERSSGKKPAAPPVAAEQPAAEQAKAAHVGWRNEKDGRPPAAGNALTDEQEHAEFMQHFPMPEGLRASVYDAWQHDQLRRKEGWEAAIKHLRAAGKDACVLGGGADGIHDPHFCKTHGVQFYGDACPGNKAMQAKSAQGGA